MRNHRLWLAFGIGMLAFLMLHVALFPLDVEAAAAKKIKVLVVTGGHDFEEEPFFAMFKAMDGVDYERAEQKESSEAYDRDLSGYDVIVLYDMVQKITMAQKLKFAAFLDKGKGVVALHHSLASYQDWNDFQKIIGGKFFTEKRTEGDVEYPQSTWKHDQKLSVKIADKAHPIVQGLKDFELLDEVYGKYIVDPKVKPLLTVDHPLSEKVVGWTHLCGKAPVAYIQLGHGKDAFENAAYRALVKNTIGWAAGQPPVQQVQTPAPRPARGGG